MPGRLAFAIVLGLWLVWAGGAWAQSPAPPGTDVARRLIAGDLAAVLDPSSASRFGIVEIASGAMEPTLQVDDRVVYDRAAYRTALPERGEVVIFRPPPSAVRTCGGTGLFVQRVVAVAGDVVRTTGTSVIVSGVASQIAGVRPPRAVRQFPPVPVGRVLVVGDNGPSSCDSVQWRAPFLPVSYVVGKVDGIVWPRDRAGLLPTGGGVELLHPAGVLRDRLDAFVVVARGVVAMDEAVNGPRICSIFDPEDCADDLRDDVTSAIRDERRALAALLPPLEADCAGAPIRTLRRALGLDFRAASGRRVGVRRLARRLRVHHGVALDTIAACWDPSSPGTPSLG